MKKSFKSYFVLLFLFFSTFSWSEVRDEENLITKESVVEIEKEIKKIYDTKKIRVIINTLEYGEGFIVQNPENTIIINIGKNEKENLRVESNFSRDLNMEENEEELNTLSDNLSPLVEKGDLEKYLTEYLNELNLILSKKEVESKESILSQVYQKRWDIIKILALVLTILNILGRIRYVSKLKKERYQKNF